MYANRSTGLQGVGWTPQREARERVLQEEEKEKSRKKGSRARETPTSVQKKQGGPGRRSEGGRQKGAAPAFLFLLSFPSALSGSGTNYVPSSVPEVAVPTPHPEALITTSLLFSWPQGWSPLPEVSHLWVNLGSSSVSFKPPNTWATDALF